jgi:N-methylhydantoinase A/oxoprolinase/acetone carboxylase beta subunit
MLLGVDVGGTFTDAVLLDDGAVHTAKVPTTPGEESEGVMAAIEAVLAGAGAQPTDIGEFSHGMTVGTNALLEECGARTALIATRGFADLLEIARQDRPSLYHLCAPKPTPLIPAELKLEAAERTGPEGIVESLGEGEPERLAAALAERGAESVAICLLFSYLDPTHERRLAAFLRERLPDLHVSASHEVLPRFREYERASTTVIDAYLSPLLGSYLGRLAEATAAAGLPAPQVMLSSGGVAPAAEAARAGAWSVLSGPAGGAVGAGLLARLSGDGNALGFDMGGTSCDVCVVEDGAVRRTDSRTIDGRPIQLPTVDVHTVGAGGGSIGWRDPGGALRVGPRSAGAAPGPACHGRGGVEPTVTDANLLLGNLAADSTLAGGVALDVEAAERAVGALAGELGLDPIETAAGIVRVANQEMVRALRVVTVERGVDPRRFALLPFGGAGPMHAAAIAAELGIRRLLCPRAGGVLSAFGLCVSDRRRDTARTVMLTGDDLSAERVGAAVRELREAAAGAERVAPTVGDPEKATRTGGLDEARAEVVYGMRYAGQAFELPVPGDPEPDPADLVARFEAAHEERYGHRDPDGDVVLVDIRLALVIDGPGREMGMTLSHEQHGGPDGEAGVTLSHELRGGSFGSSPPPRRARAEENSRAVRFDDEWIETPVLRGEPEAGRQASGPVIFELPEATLVLPPGWQAEIDKFGTIVATRATQPGDLGEPERTSPQFVSEGSPRSPEPRASEEAQ